MSMYIEKFRPRKADKPKISVGYIALIFLVVVFFYRVYNVIDSYSERGAHSYVQLLNYTMPIVEEQIYDEGAYSETTLTMKKVIFEAIGLNDITTYGIVGREVAFLNSFESGEANIIKTVAGNNNGFAPFKLDSESISMITDEELREISNNSSVYRPELKEALEDKGLEVLIYHTHSQEAYAEVGSEDRWFSPNKSLNVTGVGDILTQELEEGYGIKVIHDETMHDAVYNMSYDESNETIKRYLNEYDDFDLIIDLHRDSVDRDLTAVNINDEDLSRIMFVVGRNSPIYEANRALVDDLATIGEKLFPGIYRGLPVLERETGVNGGYNLGLDDKMLLLEVGGIGNTVEESKRTAKYIARIIAEYLYNEINE